MEPGRKCAAQSWLDVWGLAAWIYCLSGQGERLQEHRSDLSCVASGAIFQ